MRIPIAIGQTCKSQKREIAMTKPSRIQMLRDGPRVRRGGVRSGQHAAFSLIEVLIAVLVLGLGLLGLAAIFPVVIDAQRTAVDRSLAVSASDSIEAAVLNHSGLNFKPVADGPAGFRGLQAWQRDLNWSEDGEWVLPDEGGNFTIDGNDGKLTIAGFNGGSDLDISMRERLFPVPYTRGTEPRFVWDIIARRVPQGIDPSTGWSSEPTVSDPLEVAIFIRRIETGVRAPDRARSRQQDWPTLGRRVRLSDVLTQSNEVNAAERRLPVGMRSDGRASGEGRAPYALPFEVRIATSPTYGTSATELPNDYLAIQSSTWSQRVSATQVGQKLLDARGNVYTVLRVDDSFTTSADTVVVQVDRPVASWIRSRPSPLDPTLNFNLITTPQVMSEIRVVRITP